LARTVPLLRSHADEARWAWGLCLRDAEHPYRPKSAILWPVWDVPHHAGFGIKCEHGLVYDFSRPTDLEIVGNIHENPELIEVES